MDRSTVRRLWGTVALIGICLSGCRPGLTPPQTPLALPPGLQVEEHALKGAPKVEPLTFVPVEGTQEEILARHHDERQELVSGGPLPSEGEVLVGGDRVVGRLQVAATGAGSKVSVEVSRNGEVVYAAQLGDPGPLAQLQGLWAYDGHWVLEVAHVTASTEPGEFSVRGEIIQDGASLTESHGYEETFGFQLMKGKPFYFFGKSGRLGISYDSQEAMLGYTHVPHYLCCSAAELNPESAQNMVAFFAQRSELSTSVDAGWCYVEIGAFD